LWLCADDSCSASERSRDDDDLRGREGSVMFCILCSLSPYAEYNSETWGSEHARLLVSSLLEEVLQRRVFCPARYGEDGVSPISLGSERVGVRVLMMWTRELWGIYVLWVRYRGDDGRRLNYGSRYLVVDTGRGILNPRRSSGRPGFGQCIGISVDRSLWCGLCVRSAGIFDNGSARAQAGAR
jgi:hypothetical protein